MSAIANISIASSTSSNWLAEAQSAIQSAGNTGGIMGALQTASIGTNSNGSVASFLASSQSNADQFALIAQDSVQAAGQFYAQLAVAQGQKAAQDRAVRENALLNPPAQTNFTPPLELSPIIFNSDGSSIDTTSNIMTLSNGTQVDITTGLQYVDPKSRIQMANGAYLDTTSNILYESDGTQVDATTGIKITA